MLRSVTALVLLGLPATMVLAPPAGAEPLPRPSVDYVVTGKVADGTVEMAHSRGRMRLDLIVPGVPGSMTGFIDGDDGRVTVLMDMTGMRNRAVEIDLPDAYAFAHLPVEGTRVGRDVVVGQECDVWRSGSGSGAIEACVTADGIVLRAQAGLGGEPRLLFEATALRREPLEPALFELPEGVKVRKLPAGIQSIMPGLGR